MSLMSQEFQTLQFQLRSLAVFIFFSKNELWKVPEQTQAMQLSPSCPRERGVGVMGVETCAWNSLWQNSIQLFFFAPFFFFFFSPFPLMMLAKKCRMKRPREGQSVAVFHFPRFTPFIWCDCLNTVSSKSYPFIFKSQKKLGKKAEKLQSRKILHGE